MGVMDKENVKPDVDSKQVDMEDPETQSKSAGDGVNASKPRRSGNAYSPTQPYDWKGRKESIGVILALRSERYANKVLFTTFTERLCNHVAQEFDYPGDIVTMIDKMEDPTSEINRKQPVDLTDDQSKSEVMKMMKKKEVETHMDRLSNLDTNKMALYGLIWGHMTRDKAYIYACII